MDFLQGLAGGGLKIDIKLTPQNENATRTDHHPSWKLHKNPFWRVQHPSLTAAGKVVVSATPPPSHDDAANPTTTAAAPYGTLSIPQQQQINNRAPHLIPEHHHQSRSELFVYESHDPVQGVAILTLPSGKKFDHLGIKIQFIGRIDMAHGIHEGRPHYDFISVSKELLPPGTLFQPTTEIPFLFQNMDKEHESYCGRNVSVRYFVKVVVERKFLPPVSHEQDVWVQIVGSPPSKDEPIKMEVGIEDCLHIEFEYERRHYHLNDTITGKIHFLLVRIKIKFMELAVIRRETSGEGVALALTSNTEHNTTGSRQQQQQQQQQQQVVPSQGQGGSNIYTETQTLVKYEIMDGAPVKGEVIPVHLSLKGIPADLTPTYTAINNRFSVRYFLNLVLVDEEDRRYFKQQEIITWRNAMG